MKRFQIGTVLSATTGRLLCDIGQVYEILNHVTGDNLFTHVLPRAFRFSAPLIKAQHPRLAEAELVGNLAELDALVKSHDTPMDGCREWLERMVIRGLPWEYEIDSHADKWLALDPVKELEDMVGKEKIVVI